MASFRKGVEALVDKFDAWIVGVIEALPNLVLAVLVFSFFLYFSRWAFRLTKRVFAKTHLNSNFEFILASAARWIVMGSGIVVALSVLGLDKTVFSMLAGIGVVGLALGFALKDIAANFVSGIMLAVRAPLRAGDFIKIKDIQGTVVDIRLRDTVLRTPDGPFAVIPNSAFTDTPMINFSTYGLRRLTVDFILDFKNDSQVVKRRLVEALKAIDANRSQREPAVNATKMDIHGVTYTAELWIQYPGEDATERMDKLVTAVDRAVEENEFTRATVLTQTKNNYAETTL